MIQAITRERWDRAQLAERACHTMDIDQGPQHYRNTYKNVFAYLEMETDQHGKSILEIGPADFPALAYCSNFTGTIIEPMPSQFLSATCTARRITLITTPAETTDLPEVDEAWIFNLLQHVIDPELLIEKCKSTAKAIRYFEPVDYGTCEYHPHTFSQDDFVRWFGEAKRYTDRLPQFFDADCCYGTWNA